MIPNLSRNRYLSGLRKNYRGDARCVRGVPSSKLMALTTLWFQIIGLSLSSIRLNTLDSLTIDNLKKEINKKAKLNVAPLQLTL